jgi:hypothetical protein
VYSKAQNEKARKVVNGSLWQVLAGQYAAVPARTTYPTIAFLLMFILAGLLMGVIIHPEVRNEIARKGAHRWSFRIVTILLVIGIFASLILTIPGQVAAGTGGLLAVFPFLRRFRSMIKR